MVGLIANLAGMHFLREFRKESLAVRGAFLHIISTISSIIMGALRQMLRNEFGIIHATIQVECKTCASGICDMKNTGR